jgi:hypothetical protein
MIMAVTKKELVDECANLRVEKRMLVLEVEKIRKERDYYLSYMNERDYYREMAELAMDTIDAREEK